MSQHFLLSAAARSISLRSVLRMEENEAWTVFCRIRWHSTEGRPVCPHCGSLTSYDVSRTTHPRYRCRDCRKDFTPTSGTLFAYHKQPITVYLAAIVLFVNAVKGISALQLGRDLDLSYKSAFVLCHKMREAMASEMKGVVIGGEDKVVEADGCFVGGCVRPANRKEDRVDRRKAENRSDKRRAVVAIRERDGRIVTAVFNGEEDATSFIKSRVAAGTVLHTDESKAWDELVDKFTMHRVCHRDAYSHDGACTNMVESYFSRLRRAEWGQHHHISGIYLARYASEMAWREDHRRRPNGTLFRLVAFRAATMRQSVDFTGYWQRRRSFLVSA